MSARDALVEAAARAFAAHGYHGVSMRDLARSTGRSPATFYSHFASKQELLFSIQRDAFDALIAGAEETIAAAEGAEARLRAFIRHHVRYFTAHVDMMRVLIHEASVLPSRARALVRARKERYFAIARELVAAVMRARSPAPLDARAVERATYCAFGMLNWTYAWYRADEHGSVDELADTIFAILAGRPCT